MIMKNKGFTLLEIIVVLVILGFLVASITPRLSRTAREAAITTTLSEMKEIKEAIRDNFYPDLGLIPEDTDHPEWATRYLCLKNDGTGNSEYEEMRGFIGDDLMTWDRYVSKGWRGPYMERETSDTPVLADVWFDSEKAEADTPHYYRIIFSDLDSSGDMTNSDADEARRERLSSRIVSFGANGSDDGGGGTTPLPADIGDDLVMFIFGTEPIQSP